MRRRTCASHSACSCEHADLAIFCQRKRRGYWAELMRSTESRRHHLATNSSTSCKSRNKRENTTTARNSPRASPRTSGNFSERRRPEESAATPPTYISRTRAVRVANNLVSLLGRGRTILRKCPKSFGTTVPAISWRNSKI
jgi:hypothetical protein